jgi:uncharacterized protein (DUF4415 family)
VESWARSEPHLARQDQNTLRKMCEAEQDYVQYTDAKEPRSTGRTKTEPAASLAVLRIISKCA